ncbi:MAG: RnfABCDGE type electron transport complex subunit D [Chitinivibrionales bacterium]|nr:RnfABCDGE type electron transport complex subunit D [Chitinivibrionales bacterium]
MSSEQKLLHISTSPHVKHIETVPSIMLCVCLALIPAFAASVYLFRLKALVLTAVCVISCLATEWSIVRFLLKKPSTLGDFSALLTGILLAFNLPPDLPPWMAAVGSVFAIGVAKWAFGGLGHNFVNPALAGRAFLTASYAAPMTVFNVPDFWKARGWTISGLSEKIIRPVSDTLDGISGATPLPTFSGITEALHAESARLVDLQFHIIDFQEALPRLFFGNVGGCIGETSAAALILGAIFLWYKHIIGIRVPVLYIGTVFLLTWLFNGTGSFFTSEALLVPVYQILAGGLMLGALFMATDMVTSPVTPKGKMIFGVGCGILTFTIRKFGGYPEGVSYSILLMNLTVPLIDRYTRPKIYGKVKKNA